MKKILFLFLFIAFAKISIAQELYQDMIYLKNGEIINGVLVNEVLNVSVTIVNQKGDTLTFQMDDIQKLSREKIVRENTSTKEQWLKPGYELTIEVAKAIGVGEFGIDYFQADIINGVRLNSYIYSGFGIGLTYINDSKYDYYPRPKTIVPVYLDIRINYPLSNRISPYLTFDFGGSFNKSRLYIGGDYSTDFLLLLKTSFGTHLRISQKMSLNIAVGFRSQEMPFIHIQFPERYMGIHTDMHLSNSINIISGLTF